MSEASDRVMCKRMVRFGKDLVLDVNQVTAVEGINVYLDDGRHFDISQEAADKLQEWFAPGDKGSRNIDLFVTLKAAADEYKKFCDSTLIPIFVRMIYPDNAWRAVSIG